MKRVTDPEEFLELWAGEGGDGFAEAIVGYWEGGRVSHGKREGKGVVVD